MTKKKLGLQQLIILIIGLLFTGIGIGAANKHVPLDAIVSPNDSSQVETGHPDLAPVLAGTSASINQSLALFTEPEAGMAPLIGEIDAAQKSVDLVMYSFNDPLIEAALIRAHGRGLPVRVMLNAGWKGEPSKKNVATRTYLLSKGVDVQWSPAYFALTHQKTLIIDAKRAIIMTFNIDKTYYKKDRDFGVLDTDPKDVTAIAQAFESDWNLKKVAASDGRDLVWSPGSESELVALIDSAESSIMVYNEEMDEIAIEDALASAARRGVEVQVVITNSSNWLRAFRLLSDAGVHIYTYSSSSKAPIYIHAKMILVDTTRVFLGSENFSHNSLEANRELGIVIAKPDIVAELGALFKKDMASATLFTTQ